jgi:hypothetical protein
MWASKTAEGASSTSLYAHVVKNGHLAPYVSSFDEYLTLYIQFGQVLMFSAFFPLAPACAWVSNMLESRLDGYKLLRDVRRSLPLTHCAEGIGPAWTEAFETVVYLSVLTNLASIALFAPAEFWAWAMEHIKTVATACESVGTLPDGYTAAHLEGSMPFWVKVMLIGCIENFVFYILFKISQLPDSSVQTREQRIDKEVRWRKAIERYNRDHVADRRVSQS